MQPLTAPPREHLTDAQVMDLLTGPGFETAAGLELLGQQNRFVEDLTGVFVEAGSTVTHDGRETVHGDCKLIVQRELAWGRARLRPYLTLSNAGVSARFNLGVFVLTTPQTRRGEDVPTYEVTGYDLLQLLIDPIGDTWVAPAAITYDAAIRAAIAAAGAGVPLLLDGTRQDAVLASPMVWALSDSDPATWLIVVNDLLAAIGYDKLWCDENGNYRSQPSQPALTRPIGWVFDLDDEHTDVVDGDLTIDEDVWKAPNRWTFVARGWPTRPVEGNGLYVVENDTTGPSSYESIGRWRPKEPAYLDAADQAALEAQGDAIVAADMAVTRQITLMVDPLPIVGHLDVVQVRQTLGGQTYVERAEVVSSTIDLGGARAQWVVEAVR